MDCQKRRDFLQQDLKSKAPSHYRKKYGIMSDVKSNLFEYFELFLLPETKL